MTLARAWETNGPPLRDTRSVKSSNKEEFFNKGHANSNGSYYWLKEGMMCTVAAASSKQSFGIG